MKTGGPGTTTNLYRLTIVFGIAGAVGYCASGKLREGLAFALGAACSLGNLWLFDWLSRAISPGSEAARKPWRAGAFISRYLLLFSFGSAIVKGLGVSPLAVVLGLLCSAAAALTSVIFELAALPFKGRTRTE